MSNHERAIKQMFEEEVTKTSALRNQVAGDHYKKCAIQPIEYIFANQLGYAEGNCIKYLTRWKDKGGIEDLRKAKHYIELLIESEDTGDIRFSR
jgi:hypothetical protein